MVICINTNLYWELNLELETIIKDYMGFPGFLSADQLHSFDSQGFLVVESFACTEEINGMRKRMDLLLNDFDCASPAKNQKNMTPDYYLESAEKISFFLEGKALDDDGNLTQLKQLSISYAGHALHEIDPVFRDYSRSEKILSLLASLSYRRPVIIQSVYIFKQPGIGGGVAPHQDSSALYTEPKTCTGFWLALEDATTENGCLWAIPGSHKNGLVRRFTRSDHSVQYDQPSPSYDKKDFVPIEVKGGSLVLIHGDLIHQSFENQSSKSRHAYSIHAVDTDGCKWAPENWIRRKVDPEPLYIS